MCALSVNFQLKAIMSLEKSRESVEGKRISIRSSMQAFDEEI